MDKNKNLVLIVVDIIWLIMIMIGIFFAGKHESIREYMHYIVLIIWYIGARYLATTWDK